MSSTQTGSPGHSGSAGKSKTPRGAKTSSESLHPLIEQMCAQVEEHALGQKVREAMAEGFLIDRWPIDNTGEIGREAKKVLRSKNRKWGPLIERLKGATPHPELMLIGLITAYMVENPPDDP